MRSSCSEHGAIVTAILAADAAAAREAMRAHVTNTSVHVIRYFKEQNEEAP
jgi:DNA-binding GntR family transcriptional regulator